MTVAPPDQLRLLLTRRRLLQRAGTAGLAAMAASAVPLARAARAKAGVLASPLLPDATLQAFADTILPGRKVSVTALGDPVDPLAIAGVDPLPGAVEADALALFHHPEIGFDSLEPSFLAELEARSLPHGGDFLHLSFDQRVQVCLGGLDQANPTLLLWDAAAAVPFTAFCAAALIVRANAADAPGYAVMGLPGTASHGYRGYSYRRRCSRERTKSGSLP